MIYDLLNLDFSNLAYVLLGGELTVLSLFFALIPIILDKYSNEYYLTEKLTDFFLFNDKNKNKLLKIWKEECIWILISFFLTLGHQYVLVVIPFLIFAVNIYFYIYEFMNFISSRKDTKKAIEEKFHNDLINNKDETINKLVDISHKDLNLILDNMKYLSKKYPDYFSIYTNKILIYDNKYEFEIYNLIKNIEKDNDHKLKYRFNKRNLYKFIKYNVDEYKVDNFIELIDSFILTNYHNVINNENSDNIIIDTLFIAIRDANIKNSIKDTLKQSIIYNSYCFDNEANCNDPKYSIKLRYLWNMANSIIDFNEDIYLFLDFLDCEKEGDIWFDLHFLIYSYLYYIIIVESTKYVTQEEKEKCKLLYDKINEHYYRYNIIFNKLSNRLNSFFKNLDSISDDWEKFNIGLRYTAKYACVIPTIKIIKKMLSIYCYRYNKDIIKEDYIIKLFEDETKQSDIDDILSFAEFINIDITIEEVNKFINLFKKS